MTIETLEQMDPSAVVIIDMRAEEDFKHGSLEGAVNIPMGIKTDAFVDQASQYGKDKLYCLFCYTGNQGQDYADALKAAGFSVAQVEGGYRSLLRLQLSRVMMQDEAVIRERTQQIERSLITTYRKSIWRRFTKAVHDYQLIQEGDKIAVCISGGKDSMLMAKLLQELQRHGKVKFELVFLVMNPGYNEENWDIVKNNAALLGIPLTVFESDIFNVVSTIDQSPCYLCARMRRGYLYSHAKELGCNKIALGHHFDDMIETVLMGMLYSGKIETMMPKLHSRHFAGMELIRPMYMVRESDIKAWRDYNGLHFIQCACRFTESNAAQTEGKLSKRDEMKSLIADLRKKSKVIETNIFNSVHNINLTTVIGYHKGDMQYNFLDDYDDWED